MSSHCSLRVLWLMFGIVAVVTLGCGTGAYDEKIQTRISELKASGGVTSSAGEEQSAATDSQETAQPEFVEITAEEQAAIDAEVARLEAEREEEARKAAELAEIRAKEVAEFEREQNGGGDEAASDNAPDDNAPDDNAPDENAPDENAPDENAPDENAPDENAADQ